MSNIIHRREIPFYAADQPLLRKLQKFADERELKMTRAVKLLLELALEMDRLGYVLEKGELNQKRKVTKVRSGSK